MPIATLATRRPGETGDDSIHPLLGNGPGPGLIAMDRYDGPDAEYLTATEVIVNEIGGKELRPVQRFARVTFEVCITDGRLALACPKWDPGPKINFDLINPFYLLGWPVAKLRASRRMRGKIMVGQIRYPWIAAVGACRRGGGAPDAIRIRYVEQYPNLRLYKMLELRFAKGTDATLIAQDIIRRVAAYRLAHYPGMDDAERDAFARLRQDPPLPDPKPKQFDFTAMPIYFSVNKETAFPQ